MTRIIEFLIALGIVAVLALAVGLVLPSHRHISESVETNRKMTIVYDTVNNLNRFKDWNPLVLRDPHMQLNVSGPAAGVGARLDYNSTDGRLGQGSWEIVESVPNEKVVIKVENPQRGHEKKVQFLLEPTGKNNRNVKITQTYDVDYGWNLLGRYAGLYVSRHVGDDVKLGLGRMTNMLASVPNFDYRAEGVPLVDLKLVDLPAEDLLVVTAGNIERNNDAIKQSIKNNQEWIKRTMEANNLEAAGPLRIITTDFGAERYAFDVAVRSAARVRRRRPPPLPRPPRARTRTPSRPRPRRRPSRWPHRASRSRSRSPMAPRCSTCAPSRAGPRSPPTPATWPSWMRCATRCGPGR